MLRKLEPLMPQQVTQWSRTLTLAQPTVKQMVERQVRSTAYRILGDYQHRILLSLPPKNISSGQLHLGTVLYEDEKWEFSLRLSELMQNLAIFGRSGAGKTNVSFHLLKQLVDKKVHFLFLDWKRTVRHLIPLLGKKIKVYTPGRSISPFPFNPFIVPPGVDASAYVNQLVDVMADAYTLGDGATSVLQRAIHACYSQGAKAPSIQQVLNAIDDLPSNQRSVGWKISAQRACESLLFSDTVASSSADQLAFAKNLLNQNTIIELDGIAENTKQFLIPLLCSWIYSVRLANNDREKLRFVIFLEEAHHTLYKGQRAKETLMNVLLRQCRELGMGIVLIDQHPHLISSAGIGNCYTTICMNQKDPNDVSKAVGLSGMEDADRWCLNQLSVGQGIVKLQDRWRKPILVQFPLVDIKKGLVTDEMLMKLEKGEISWSEIRERSGVKVTAGERSRSGATSLESGAVELLHDIAQHPEDGVDIRYRRLGASIDKGNRWKNQLVEHGLISPRRVKVGRTHRVLLRLTENALKLMTPREGRDPQASFLHEYWKQRIAKHFTSQGYKVELEAPRTKGGGKMDISASRASEKVSIEIETGKSDVVTNVKRDLLSGAQTVFVVATDETAFGKLEQKLAKERLLIPNRVELVEGEALVRQDKGKLGSHVA
ncbi:helicase HerA domain-containing protein [Bythopirellula polymerisocia]|uniref:helicase HerA domain-containing protein n=1 Tax=Bythopirellula polymerisocia TaxID=2528003 RepID=UPI001E2AC515|nr:DUF87 domain-containing protein [Bythopirellula polymerisocia]